MLPKIWYWTKALLVVFFISWFIGNLKNFHEDDSSERIRHSFNYDLAAETFIVVGLVVFFGTMDALNRKKKESA